MAASGGLQKSENPAGRAVLLLSTILLLFILLLLFFWRLRLLVPRAATAAP